MPAQSITPPALKKIFDHLAFTRLAFTRTPAFSGT
jgi:hypothetical protein